MSKGMTKESNTTNWRGGYYVCVCVGACVCVWKNLFNSLVLLAPDLLILLDFIYWNKKR